MKKGLLFLALFLLPAGLHAAETNILWGSEPTNVTQTANTLTFSYVEGTQNSACAWTQLRGSAQSTTFARRWYITNPDMTYNIYYTYDNSVSGTTAIPTDVGFISKGTYIPTKLMRRLSVPNGVYVHTTFTTVYAGTAAPTIKVYFESEK